MKRRGTRKWTALACALALALVLLPGTARAAESGTEHVVSDEAGLTAALDLAQPGDTIVFEHWREDSYFAIEIEHDLTGVHLVFRSTEVTENKPRINVMASPASVEVDGDDWEITLGLLYEKQTVGTVRVESGILALANANAEEAVVTGGQFTVNGGTVEKLRLEAGKLEMGGGSKVEEAVMTDGEIECYGTIATLTMSGGTLKCYYTVGGITKALFYRGGTITNDVVRLNGGTFQNQSKEPVQVKLTTGDGTLQTVNPGEIFGSSGSIDGTHSLLYGNGLNLYPSRPDGYYVPDSGTYYLLDKDNNLNGTADWVWDNTKSIGTLTLSDGAAICGNDYALGLPAVGDISLKMVGDATLSAAGSGGYAIIRSGGGHHLSITSAGDVEITAPNGLAAIGAGRVSITAAADFTVSGQAYGIRCHSLTLAGNGTYDIRGGARGVSVYPGGTVTLATGGTGNRITGTNNLASSGYGVSINQEGTPASLLADLTGGDFTVSGKTGPFYQVNAAAGADTAQAPAGTDGVTFTYAPAPAPAARDDDDDGPEVYLVTCRPGYENGPQPVRTSHAPGDRVTVPKNPFPAPAGMAFAGWAETGGGNAVYAPGDTFSMPDHMVTLYAVWRAAGWENPYADVAEGDWYYDAVAELSAAGVLTGTGPETFSPDRPVTRGMAAAVLHRLAGSPQAAGEGGAFSDLPGDSWCAGAAAWCAETGVMGGYADGRFGPDDPITRQQLAAVLWRYAKYMGRDVSVGEDTNILSYADAFDVAEYAVPAFQWACGAGVLRGTADGRLAPAARTTRAQLAVMLARLEG